MPQSVFVYIHGMGSRYRNEESSSILDKIDIISQESDKASIGKARNFEYTKEKSNYFDKYIPLIKFKRITKLRNKEMVSREIKFYECYWSPKALNTYPLIRIILWIVQQVLNPVRVLMSPWRSYMTYRIRCLHEFGKNSPQSQIEKIEGAYIDFEKWQSRRIYPRGSFTDFQIFLEKK